MCTTPLHQSSSSSMGRAGALCNSTLSNGIEPVVDDAGEAPPKQLSKALNPNVRLTLVFALLLSASNALLTGTPLAAYILLITRGAKSVPQSGASDSNGNDNLAVGLSTAVTGMVNLVCAVPAGMLADRLGRQRMLRLASAAGVVAASYTAFCFLYLRERISVTVLYYALVGAAALQGVFMGLHAAPLEALFGDSVQSGSRSKLYAYRQSMRTAGGALAPVVSVFIFLATGDTWRESDLVMVMLAGVAAQLLPAAILPLFRDANALGAASEGLMHASARRGSVTVAHIEAQRQPPRHVCGLSAEGIAPLVALSDLLSMLGSGMTIKFFALFFWNDLQLKPVAVSLIYTAGPLGISAFTLLAQRLSLYLGRLQVVLLCRTIGISLLVSIALLDPHAASAASCILPIYLLRTWLMNCTGALTKSVLNDYVPKKHRAKWNSLESLNVFSWSGSAMLGGLLIDRFGYNVTFLITASLQGCSMLCITPLVLLVHAEEGAHGFAQPATRASTLRDELLGGTAPHALTQSSVAPQRR